MRLSPVSSTNDIISRVKASGGQHERLQEISSEKGIDRMIGYLHKVFSDEFALKIRGR